jgi:hypothetical protein
LRKFDEKLRLEPSGLEFWDCSRMPWLSHAVAHRANHGLKPGLRTLSVDRVRLPAVYLWYSG